MRDFRSNHKTSQRRKFDNRVDILGNTVQKMYKTKCDKCGKICEVPFKPSNGKPVYCNDCFGSSKEQSNTSYKRSFNKPDYNEKHMFQAICDDCGKTCDLPFKPSSNKPVYCSDCFEKRGNGNKGTQGDNRYSVDKQLDEINQKLNTILALLKSQED